MGQVFTAKNRTTGMHYRFFLSTKDFLERRHSDSELGGQDINLTLGGTFSEWFDATNTLSDRLYPQVVEGIRHFYSTLVPESVTFRHIEVLLGNQIALLCQRVARAHAQIELLFEPDDWELIPESLLTSVPYQLPTTSQDANSLVQSDCWGEFAELLVINHFFGIRRKWDITLKELPNPKFPAKRPDLRTSIYLAAQNLLAPLSSRNTISISAGFLGRFHEIMLSLLLLQVPMLTELRPPKTSKSFMRQRKLEIHSENELHLMVVQIMKSLVPTMLMEDLLDTMSQAKKIGFPDKAQVFFTSNSFSTDDLFKANLFEALDKAFYIVGQHGNNYGVAKNFFVSPEMNASDLFLSWGWVHPTQKVLPLGQLRPKLRGQKPRAGKKQKIILFLRHELSARTFADVDAVGDLYYDKVIRLCREMDLLGLNISLRLHGSTSDLRIGQLEYALADMASADISQASASFQDLLDIGARIVFTYDTTGMLEMASSKLLFFSFVPDGLGLIRPEFQGNYEALRLAGLLSEDPVEAARLIRDWLEASASQEAIQIQALASFAAGLVHAPNKRLMRIRKMLRDAETAQRETSRTK